MTTFQPTVSQKKEIDRLIAKWRPLLFLNEWRITKRWDFQAKADSPYCGADNNVDPVYKTSLITFYPHFFEVDIWELREDNIVHELCHCITQPMRRAAFTALVEEKLVPWREFRNIDESVTSHVANALVSLEASLRKGRE